MSSTSLSLQRTSIDIFFGRIVSDAIMDRLESKFFRNMIKGLGIVNLEIKQGRCIRIRLNANEIVQNLTTWQFPPRGVV